MHNLNRDKLRSRYRNFSIWMTTDIRFTVALARLRYAFNFLYLMRKDEHMKRSFGTISLIIGLSLPLSSAAAEDLVETAATSGTLKTFVAAVNTAGLTEKLKTSGPYTVFAPTDSAFQNLPSGQLDALLKDKAKLAEVLAYHIIPGKVTVSDVKPGEEKTVQGEPLKLTSDNGMVRVNGASVIQSDVEADNGIIHEIDAIVMPPR
jgi:hypothetical protein